MAQTSEVRYEFMRPAQIVAAREAFPAVYLPIGTLEWHGPHNPVGLDAIKAHALAVRCAQAGGGLVFPALFYGESREEGLMEANAPDKAKIAAAMGLPPENFAPGYMRFSPQEQYQNYQRLLLHCLYEAQSLGFVTAVFVAGHYPLIDHARAAGMLFHQARWNNRRASMIVWAFTGYELVKEEFPDAGDHAGFWETSLLQALLPGLADLSQLPPDGTPPTGVQSSRPVGEATAEYGDKAVELIVQRVVEQVSNRVHDPHAYYAHGLRV